LKSSIHFSKNTASSTINSIGGIFPYKKALISSKYLGLPLFFGKSKSVVFRDILEKVYGKIEGWCTKTLSQASRTVLIKLVQSSIPSYSMSSFVLPISIISFLDRIFKKFWRGFPKEKSKNLSLKSWSSIFLSREARGLGFRQMHEFNLPNRVGNFYQILIVSRSNNFIINTSNKRISFLLQVPLQHHGFGKVSRKLNLLSPLGLA
jgi:hypothetical protein